MLNGETEMNLRAVLNRIEGHADVTHVHLLLYMLVSFTLRDPASPATFCCVFIV